MEHCSSNCKFAYHFQLSKFISTMSKFKEWIYQKFGSNGNCKHFTMAAIMCSNSDSQTIFTVVFFANLHTLSKEKKQFPV